MSGYIYLVTLKNGEKFAFSSPASILNSAPLSSEEKSAITSHFKKENRFKIEKKDPYHGAGFIIEQLEVIKRAGFMTIPAIHNS